MQTDYTIDDIDQALDIAIESMKKIDELEPKAKWKHDNSKWKYRFICSNCGHKIYEEQQPYCSNCGARMESDE